MLRMGRQSRSECRCSGRVGSPGVNSGAPEGYAVHASLVVCIVLL